MALSGIKPPGHLILDSNASSNWISWIRSFDFYATAVGASTKAEKVQCCLFLHVAGPDAQKVHANLDIPETHRDKIVPLIQAFREHCTGKANITVTRFKFNNHNQRDENISAYIVELKDRIRHCKYGTLEESLLCDRIVSGVKSGKLRDKLLQTANLDINKCITIC